MERAEQAWWAVRYEVGGNGLAQGAVAKSGNKESGRHGERRSSSQMEKKRAGWKESAAEGKADDQQKKAEVVVGHRSGGGGVAGRHMLVRKRVERPGGQAERPGGLWRLNDVLGADVGDIDSKSRQILRQERR